LASIFTQLIDEARRQRSEEIPQKEARGEISPAASFIQRHFGFSLVVMIVLMWLLALVIDWVIGR